MGALPYTTPPTLGNPRLPSPDPPSTPATATDTPPLTPRNTWPRAPHFDLGLSRRARRPLLPRGHALSSRIRRGPRQIRKRSRTSRRRRPPLVAHRALVRRTMGHARSPPRRSYSRHLTSLTTLPPPSLALPLASPPSPHRVCPRRSSSRSVPLHAPLTMRPPAACADTTAANTSSHATPTAPMGGLAPATTRDLGSQLWRGQ